MALRPKLQNFRARKWEDARDSWLEHIPSFPSIGAPPQPGLENLQPLLEIALPRDHGRFPDVAGLRQVALWEAVFLFHKCSHTSLAAQRLADRGMHSWALFNGYHSAYLGARGMMALLGVALPRLYAVQVAIDLYPEPETATKKRAARSLGSSKYQEFIIVPLKPLDQRDLWEAFQRVLRITDATCWDLGLRKELDSLDHDQITRPRNRFLYKAAYWPLADLTSDLRPGMTGFAEEELNTEDPGFLSRLSFVVYRLFEQLMGDLGAYSATIKEQLDGARFLADSDVPELDCYKGFLSQRNIQPGEIGDSR